MKLAVATFTLPLLALLLMPFTAFADMIGSSGCGKPVVVRGEVAFANSEEKADQVLGATQQEMYERELFGKHFYAEVEGLKEGSYQVEIYIAETYHDRADRRIFDITYEDKVLADDLDLIAELGPSAEYVLTATVYHREDNINGPLSLRFEAKLDNAKFNAIIVRDADGAIVACAKAKDFISVDEHKLSIVPEVHEAALYWDANYSVEERVADLIRRMSVLEKVGQLQNSALPIDRLGLPAYDYWNECLHGVARAGTATVFPQAIGMAAMWDPEMMQTVGDVIATEARAKNNKARAENPNTARYFGLTFWTPNINIFRDPRWGRGHETYGEDPYLTGELAVAFIKGLQGGDPEYLKAAATVKHFAVHSGPEPLRHEFDAVAPVRDFYETYLPHFERAVKGADVEIVMSVYNAVYGVPGPASELLLTDLLREQWGFNGHVVSDCGGVYDVWARHKYVQTAEEGAAISLIAGNDLNCGSSYGALAAAFNQGLISESDLDLALTRVLSTRFKLGLFDDSERCAYLQIPHDAYDTPEHSKLALQVARRSMVLLENDGILPLDTSKYSRVAVIGPNADESVVLHANYNGDATNPVSVLQGIRDQAGEALDVSYARGCEVALREGETFSAESPQAQQAIQMAKDSDLVIYVGGLNAHLEGEEMGGSRKPFVGFHGGDRTSIEMLSHQTELLQALSTTGTPVVLVNLAGSAIAMPWEAENLPAILQAWYPGQNGGTAVADVLFGNYNPAGRLPVTFYRSTEDLPHFEDYSMRNRTYRYFEGEPLYAFGHGLSYTEFSYGSLQLSSDTITNDSSVKVSVEVENTGEVAGDEVVQLYVKHQSTQVKQANKSLAGFKRVTLEAGESKVVSIDLPASALRFWNIGKGAYDVPTGQFEIQVGASSTDIRQRVICSVK